APGLGLERVERHAREPDQPLRRDDDPAHRLGHVDGDDVCPATRPGVSDSERRRRGAVTRDTRRHRQIARRERGVGETEPERVERDVVMALTRSAAWQQIEELWLFAEQ